MQAALNSPRVGLWCSPGCALSQSLGLAQGEGPEPPVLLSLQCHALCSSLPLPSSPSTFSCTAAFWTRSWRSLSWIYQGHRGEAWLCFAPLPTLITASLGCRTEGQEAQQPSQPCWGGCCAAQNKVQSPGYPNTRDVQSCPGEGISLSLWLPSPQTCPGDL